MDTQTLKTFIVLSKLKNFTLTAEHLFVAQSTVTNRIAELEKEVGKKLFMRERKNLSLTQEGQIFFQYASRILELEENAFHSINANSLYQSTIRIGTTNSIYECHLYKKIQLFLDQQKSTSTKVVIGHSLELIEMLQDQLLDVVYSYLPLKKLGFISETYISDELVLVTSPKDTSFLRGIHVQDLTKIRYLYCNFALQEVGQFIRALFPPFYQFPFEIDNGTKLIPYLLNGSGYSFLPKSMVATYLQNAQLIEVPIIDFDTPRIISYKIYRENNISVHLLDD